MFPTGGSEKSNTRRTKMARRVSLSAVNSELRLANNGVTIKVDDDAPERSGRLRIGRAKIVWTPKFKQIGFGKTWEQLIDFLKS